MAVIARIELVVRDAERLASFYEAAFGCARIGLAEEEGEIFATLLGAPGARARSVRLQLGGQCLALLQVTPSGAPIAADGAANDAAFQHLAITVSDMGRAFESLSRQPGWRPISRGGPVRLPPGSGGVAAYKFRDPEGHPLELLAFPRDAMPPAWHDREGLCLGIDHSAIVVSDTARSIDFYQTMLGFSVRGGSHNIGPEQDALDGLNNADVTVTSLASEAGPPFLELLCYRHPRPCERPPWRGNDGVATRLVLAVDLAALRRQWARCHIVTPTPLRGDDGSAYLALRDPDGHRLLLVNS